MIAEARVKQWGNSLGIIIPRGTVRQEDIHEGDTISVEIVKKKRVDGFGMFKGGPRFKEEDIIHKEFL
ncbi:AbrB/MazE/SpoVT family DNA-binding domain-containing protein [Candidatus Woesearchaeota archaeon]|nr:AbrB/MazE/SpoVT family DNA-binding domain-containing protein [Candidatus Woesearchaeota archaeon]